MRADVTPGKCSGKIEMQPRLNRLTCAGETVPLGEPERLGADPPRQRTVCEADVFAKEVWGSSTLV